MDPLLLRERRLDPLWTALSGDLPVGALVALCRALVSQLARKAYLIETGNSK